MIYGELELLFMKYLVKDIHGKNVVQLIKFDSILLLFNNFKD